MSAEVQGRCPMGCGNTLFLGSGGYVTCSWHKCPNPGAAADILLDHSHHEHIVVLEAGDYRVQHPLRERLNGELFDCPLDAFLHSLAGPPRVPGRYRVYGSEAPFSWAAADLPVALPEETPHGRG